MLREPAVAGQFYRGSPELLREEVRGYMVDATKEDVLGCVSPHAGLMYSGHVAGAVYSSVNIPETVVLIGPNHTGLGSRISVFPDGEWVIPTGSFFIDRELGDLLFARASDILARDSRAHMFEHSLEVQLPFLSLSMKPPRILPIVMMQASTEECRLLGEAISAAALKLNRRILVVASSDMSHYVSDNEARRLDNLAIERILALDPEGLYNTVISKRISMCGYLPVTTMLYYALSRNASEARLVKYATSGEISGDYDHVVGYAGIIVK